MNSIFIQVLLLLSITACGTVQDSVDPFDAEVVSVSPGSQFATLGSNWNLVFNEDFNDMYQNEWYGVAVVSPDSMPENCNQAVVFKAGVIDDINITGLEAGRHYFARFCAKGAHKTSTGMTYEFDFQPE